MEKITFSDFRRIMLYDITVNQKCIELEFIVDNVHEYQNAWLGKMQDSKTKNVIYWFGLTEDGSQAYDYDSFEKFASAKVFSGKNIEEIWHLISLRSIDACDVQERLKFYLI
jgi:hypothetical protein